MPRLKNTPAEIEKYLAMLAETPRCIAACSSAVVPSQLTTAPGPREWSALEILAHLRACDDAWSYSIYAMLTQEQPTLTLPDERRWSKVLGYASQDFQLSLQTFSLKRAELIAVLQGLEAEAWNRTANIEGRTHSVFSQARRMALHEQAHCNQIEALLSANERNLPEE
jgi:hypothetical protein